VRNPFNVGDVVRLKSGGPAMTVKTVMDNLVVCVWFTAEGKVVWDKFNHATLDGARGADRSTP
jgi:uncharacterized protein YodC (DUF2158 family)